jgi:transcriptional regulator
VLDIIDRHGFGSLITVQDQRPFVSHVPMYAEKSERLLIYGHLANANSQLEQLDDNPDVLVTFQGPHCYISPTWYRTASVPTWNYVAIHCYGSGRSIRDQEKIRHLVETLTHKYEQQQNTPWQPDYPDRLLKAITGFEIEVSSIQSKFKLSQNRGKEDRASIIQQLEQSSSAPEQGVVQLMHRLNKR